MAVTVIKDRVRVEKKTYFPGDTIDGLTKKEENRLIDLGVCSPASAAPSAAAEESGPNTDHPGM